ncbi:MAG: TldD/PmbA family protein [Synergistaceae bacterium]|jgi:TldD protein|nr:TldD/PmbA family protein [Synergistaceae bacterium]
MGSSNLDGIREIFSCVKGVDYADLYMQSGASHSVMYEDGRMDTLSSSVSDGVGVRVLKDECTAYAHAMGTALSSARAAMEEVRDMSGAIMALPDGGDERLMERAASLPALDVGFFHDLDAKLRGECKYLRQVTFRYRTSWKSVLVVRGDGEAARDDRAYTTFAVSVVLERGGELETGYEARSFERMPDDFWRACGEDGSGTAERIARTALSRGLLMLDALPCPAGVMTVLMDGTAGGTMIHEACGHGLEADIVQKDFSAFRDKIGHEVAAPIVTIVDDATLPGMYGSYLCDDEGTPAGRTVLVENGVLESYMTDILSARRGGLPRTGNGRRESYRHMPLPRMSNTFVVPGESEYGEMLEAMGEGILVKKMGGGEVNPTSGDFVFHVSEGYLVRGGKIGSPVKGAILTGNGPQALWNIAAVGRKLILDPGVCGKSGQGVPVTDGQPALLIKNLTVGGVDAGNG